MANWLKPIQRGLALAEHMSLARQDLQKLITEGVDIIMKQTRTNLIPRFIYQTPLGVKVVANEEALGVYFVVRMALAVQKAEWPTERFAYPAKKMSDIEQTEGWRALVTGLARHDFHPALLMEKDVYCFGGKDWHVAQLKLCVGLG